MLTTDATNLHRLMNCNGSRHMPPSFPTIDTDPTARDEGNAAHWAAQEWFNGRDPETLINAKAYNGVIVTGEMIDHVSEYLKAIDPGRMEVETSFGTDRWRVNARADHISYRNEVEMVNGGNGNVLEFDNWTLTIDDFKYGHRLVSPVNNWTLIAHAIGYCLFNQITPQTIRLRIHQPRPYHPDGKLREWTIDYLTLRELYQQIDATLTNPRDALVTGIDWCAKCRALATCPAAHTASMNAVDASTLTFNEDIPDAAMTYELDTLRSAQAMLSARLTALEELATYRIKNGAVIDGYGVETQQANTRWKTGITAQALTLASGIDCVKPGFITPAEFKRRGGSDAVYKALTERPITGVKLVRASADERAKRLLGRK